VPGLQTSARHFGTSGTSAIVDPLDGVALACLGQPVGLRRPEESTGGNGDNRGCLFIVFHLRLCSPPLPPVQFLRGSVLALEL